MVQIDLLELLSTKTITHPTRITAIQLSHDSLRMSITGYPWWQPTPDYEDTRELEIVFQGPLEGVLDVALVGPWDEALESFSATSLEHVDWAQPSVHFIYCSSSLPNALSLYAVLKDHLIDARSYKKPEDFLNFDFEETLKGFIRNTSTNSFLLARAPEGVRQIICGELTKQGVLYQVLTQKIPLETRVWVRLDNSSFLCESAKAIFDA